MSSSEYTNIDNKEYSSIISRLSLRDLIPSVLVLSIAILLPHVLMLWGWQAPLRALMDIFRISNENVETYQLPLTLIPLCVVYSINGLLFAIKKDNRPHMETLNQLSIVLCFIVPMIGAISMIAVLSLYAQKHEPFDDNMLEDTKAMLGFSIVCLFIIDTFMTACNNEAASARSEGVRSGESKLPKRP
jgi:hypothetical protein